MELTTAAIATLVITGFFTNAGTKLSDKALEQGEKLVKLLRDKFPKIAARIKATEEKPLDYGEALLIGSEIEVAAKQDFEIQDTVETIANEVNSKPELTQVIENWKGINIKGGTTTINNPNFNF